MSRHIGFCSRQRVRIPGKGFCLLPWSTSPMQNVQFNLKQKQILNFVMQGKCQKGHKYRKICEFSALFSGKSSLILLKLAKTGHTANKHFAKRPNSYLPMISDIFSPPP
jgi:hypothetical protein